MLLAYYSIRKYNYAQFDNQNINLLCNSFLKLFQEISNKELRK